MSDDSPSSADLDLRLVRCFAAVAEHGHFGRAAAASHLTPSALSRQIGRLERRLGVRLLDRTPRGARLTRAGEVFLPLAGQLLRLGAQAAAEARAAAEPGGVTVGHINNVRVAPAVREMRRRYPDADVRTRFLAWDQVREALLDHRVDAAVTRLPFRAEGLRVSVLYDEPRVLLAPADHRLAGQPAAAVEDIAGEPLPRTLDPEWNAFWRIDPRPDGRPAPDGPLVTTVEDKLELVAAGRAVAIVPGVPALAGLRPDLTTVPLEGVGPSRVVLATRANERNRLVDAFLRYARPSQT